MPPYKKSCGSVSSYVSIEHTDEGHDAFEVRLLNGVKQLQFPITDCVKYDSILATADGITPDNLLGFELIEFEKWNDLIRLLKRKPELATMKYPKRDSRVFSSGVVGRFVPQSVGNLLIHEACQSNPPVEAINSLLNAYKQGAVTQGFGGFLPLHMACTSGACHTVVAALLKAYPTSVKTTVLVQDGLMLPLHLACRHGAKKEVIELLMAYYPAASTFRDGHGQLPVDYANAIISPITRHEALKCLEQGEVMRATADATAAVQQAEHEERRHGLEDGYEVFIQAIKSKYEKEVGDLNCQLLDMEFDKTTLQDELDSTKMEMDQVMKTFTEYKSTQEKKFMELRIRGDRSNDITKKHEAELKELNDKIAELTATIEELKSVNSKQADDLEKMHVHNKEQEQCFTRLMDEEHKQHNLKLAEQSKIEGELREKIKELDMAHAFKCKLLNKVTMLAYEQKQRSAEKIISLATKVADYEIEKGHVKF